MNVDFKINRNGEFVQSLLGENLGISPPSPCLVQISWGVHPRCGLKGVKKKDSRWLGVCTLLGVPPAPSCGSMTPKLSDFLPWKLLGSRGKWYGPCSIVKICGHHRRKLKSTVVTRPFLARLKHKQDASYTLKINCRVVVRPFLT